MTTADSRMIAGQMTETGEMLVVVAALAIMADGISFVRQTTTIVFVMQEFVNNRVMMLRHQNTVDRQMTDSHITNLVSEYGHSALTLEL